jgi:hypothetical protein
MVPLSAVPLPYFEKVEVRGLLVGRFRMKEVLVPIFEFLNIEYALA